MSPRAGMLFFGIFLAFGLMGTFVGISAYLDVQEVEDWPSTTGTVTDVGVSENYVSGHKGSSSHYEYYPQVAYTYQVDGATYYGNDLAKIETSYQSYADAQGHLDQYRVGTEVTVYYNPDDPNEAVLEQNTRQRLCCSLGSERCSSSSGRWASSISTRSGGLERIAMYVRGGGKNGFDGCIEGQVQRDGADRTALRPSQRLRAQGQGCRQKRPGGAAALQQIIGVAPLGCVKIGGLQHRLCGGLSLHRAETSGFSVGIGDIGLGNPKDNFAYEYTAAARFDVGDNEKDLRAEIDYVTKGLMKKEVVDFSWKGGALAQKLNQDTQLKSMLQALGMPWIEVSASKKDGYVEIGQGHARAGTFALTTGSMISPAPRCWRSYDRIFGVVGTMRTRIVR